MREIWKPVVGYEGIYEVSSLGGIRSLDRIDRSGHRRRSRPLRPHSDKNGYQKVVLAGAGPNRPAAVHRLVLIAFVGIAEGRPFVNHINGNSGDNRVENLEWVTASENTQHAVTVLGRTMGRPSKALIARRGSEELRFGTMREARQAGFNKSAVLACVAGKRNVHLGYSWSRPR